MNGIFNRRSFLSSMAGMGTAMLLKSNSVQAEGSEKIQLAFVGGAHIHTPGFIKLLNGRSDAQVKYFWDHDPARAEKRAEELKSMVVRDLQTIWRDKDVKAVIICSETNRHPELVMEAAKARKHMFVEKPLGITARESFAMASEIEKAGLLFTTGYFNRTLPQHLFLKEQIAQGNLGKITRIRGSNCHNGSLGGWFDTEWRWMADPKVAGVGGFGDLGTHLLDILIWLIGDVERVAADIKVVTQRYGDCDESGEALVKFKNGVTGTLAAGWVDVADPVTLLVSGTEGHAMMLNGELYFKSQKVEGADGRKPWKQLPERLSAPLDMFVDAVLGKKGLPLVSPHEAAVRVSVMEAMYQAAKQKAWIRPV
jgi:predicted dehydrogenase